MSCIDCRQGRFDVVITSQQAGAPAMSSWSPAHKYSISLQGKSVSAPSRDSFDSDDATGSSPQDGHVPAAQSSGSSAAPASAKQLASGPSLDVIREDEEHGPRRLSPGSSLHSIEVCTLPGQEWDKLPV